MLKGSKNDQPFHEGKGQGNSKPKQGIFCNNFSLYIIKIILFL